MTHNTFDYRQYIRNKGYRITSQREAVVDAICKLPKHYVTPDEVFQRVQASNTAIDRSTVYRALDFLTEIGLVALSQVDGQMLYELIIGHEPHHHLVCKNCSSEIQIDDNIIAPMFETLTEKYGFHFDNHTHLLIKGLCPTCSANSN